MSNTKHYVCKAQFLPRILLLALSFFFGLHFAKAEGSLDINKNAGKRLFLYAYDPYFPQQIKVYAKAGETINVGASHVGILGGFIKVYSPKGQLLATFDDPNGAGIINNDVEEAAGPTGGGTANGSGYKPGIVSATESGVYTVYMTYPAHDFGQDWKAFGNINVGQSWTRAANQPQSIRRVILAWDITVSQNGAGNVAGANLLKGRVYSNDLNMIVNENGNSASPTLYVLSREGYLYKVDFLDVDPWGFPITSNNVGIVNGQKQPTYSSITNVPGNSAFKRTANVTDISGGGGTFYYEPQARDTLIFVNNKIFINPPANDLPMRANVTDIFRNDPHQTWLLNPVPTFTAVLSKFELNSVNANCGNGVVELAKGANFLFESNVPGTGTISLDLNNDGDFDDAIDRNIVALINQGQNKIFWDGRNGLGAFVQTSKKFTFGYKFDLRAGEIHIMFDDVENNPGGTLITRMNGVSAPNNTIYYDHFNIGGGVSGNGLPGKAIPTTELYKYGSNFGNEKLLDTWSYVDYKVNVAQTLSVEISLDCDDHDGDGVPDAVDIDDDNDGIVDWVEFCRTTKDFTCLPGSKDPSADEDNDLIPNYLDAKNNSTNVATGCVDANNDGKCDKIDAIYDTDGDNVPDHLDLDSDNDGITDLDEAGHNQPDTDRNGVIDGAPSLFGVNGLYDPIDIDIFSFTKGANYTPWDYDGDGVPDHDDLDSDNDGIYDVRETDYGYEAFDTNNDGRIDVTTTNPVDFNGLTKPVTKPIGYPKDFDKDGIPDWHDLDSDNDGINDVAEAFGDKFDLDNDGFIGTGKPIVNKDGIASASTTGKPLDTDKDGVPDWHDYDSDNDGKSDVVEAGFPDPDNDGQVGTGKPKVNQWGQPDGYNTSNPPDFDEDGVPDFRDTTCDLVLNKPIITNNGKICPGDEIILTAQSTYPAATQYVWINSKGDTLQKTGTIFKIKEDDPKAVGPFSVLVSWKDCKSNFSDAVSAVITKVPVGASFTAIDDNFKIVKNGILKDSVTRNDNITASLVWAVQLTTSPTKGTVTINKDGSFTYTPNKDFDGNDEFTYTLIYDNCKTVTSTANVIITVFRPNDKDGDDVPDDKDIDDDNDGIVDWVEYCRTTNDFSCLPGGADPSADEDGDRVPNYQDAINNKNGTKSGCIDTNNDGVCDKILDLYDTDGDNVPDHLDLDSDNDGITDLDEAGHKQPDGDRNGIIDGSKTVFGINGLYDPLDIDVTSFTKGANYAPWDFDEDGVPDHDDLDSDNDGIYDVREADYGYEKFDLNFDGRIDVTAANPVNAEGLTVPLVGKPIGYPKDFDDDSYPDWHDLDADNDGINDVAEGHDNTKLDPDNDGFMGSGKTVVDKNGVAVGTITNPTDTDQDGTPDWHDYDSDDDGIKDVVEADFPDPDNNGQVGIGKPKVNKWGQPDGYNTSTPKDLDEDGIADFRDKMCELKKPVVANGGILCPGQEIVLTVTTPYSGANQIVWLNSKNDTLAKKGTTLTLNPTDPKAAAPFRVVIVWAGCKSLPSDPVAVTIVTPPANFKAIDDIAETKMNLPLEGNVITNDAVSQSSNWTLKVTQNPANGTVTINNKGEYTYTPKKDFSGSDEFEYSLVNDLCANIFTSAKVRITIEKTSLDSCFIPNVITPNNDGDNDVLEIPCSISYPKNVLTVYNRWGAQVYNAKDYKNDWNGSYNDDLLPAGTYYYIYKLDPDSKECRTGHITILRN